MSYEVLYEIPKVNFPIDIVLPLIIGVAFGYNGFKCLRLLIQKNFSFYNFFWTIVGIVVVFFMVLLFFASFSWGGSDNAAFARKYYNGNYSVVKGIVENEYLDEKIQTYSVNGVEFVNSTVDGHGALYGAVEEGDTVRICYIIDGEGDCSENWIVKLEALE